MIIADNGYELKSRTLQGYRGISAGNCFVGVRDDGAMCQLTGHHANDHFHSVYRDNLHFPRIDVQVTAKFDVMPLLVAKEAYAAASVANLHLPHKRRRKLVLITGNDGGDTVYIGAPSSEQRGRIYNKEVQSEDIQYRKTWRYEAVFRNDLSTQLAGTIPMGLDSRAKWAAQVVSAWFTQRGVLCRFIHDNSDIVLPIKQTIPSDVAKKLAWLDHQVAPTIKWLTERGYGDTVISVLGLSPLCSPPENGT
jgi:DNA relaxase NicK